MALWDGKQVWQGVERKLQKEEVETSRLETQKPDGTREKPHPRCWRGTQPM